MALPTSGQVGLPVTDITDESLTSAAPLVTSATSGVGEDVKYVPTPNGIDDR